MVCSSSGQGGGGESMHTSSTHSPKFRSDPEIRSHFACGSLNIELQYQSKIAESLFSITAFFDSVSDRKAGEREG